MEKIVELLKKIRYFDKCIIKDKIAFPSYFKQFTLPEDLNLFYEYCGGMALFIGEVCELEVVSPLEFQRANPVIVGENCECDISYNWFIIGKGSNGQYITIDFSDNRFGYCYDSFWDRHGVVGENMIIAKSFTELIERLLTNKGKTWYWLDADFEYIGDAYDE